MTQAIRIGTRGSELALWQANWVARALSDDSPSLSPELVVIKTRGDRIQDVPLAEIGGKALFIKEIEEALLDRRIDIAVHSMKDMPGDIPEGLCIGAVPRRETTADALISRDARRLADLEPGSVVGTGSLRRTALLRHIRSDLQVLPIRGNLDTRLKKLTTGDMAAIVLAAAGLKRLGWEQRITEYLDEAVMLPAVGQGALCIEIRRDDHAVETIVNRLNHGDTQIAVTGERAFLNRLEGNCQTPIAALGSVRDGRLYLDGLVADASGATVIRDRIHGSQMSPESVGVGLAERLLSMGAEKILREYQGTGVA